MLTLNDIRGYIAGLGIADDKNVYIGKLNNKKEHSIGVYHRQGSGPPVMALGGYDYSSYDIRRISLLIHWDKDVRTSEQVAYGLYEKLKNVSILSIGGTPINCIILQVPEPVDVGTDDNGVYEYVIWLDFVYQRK
ncbi:minor capsid protein [Enterocloster citroniae]|uniref:minor capsid protein n=1 Tax=Enterocloster citroniae TaxID=358743 RepID=UPI0034A2F0A5